MNESLIILSFSTFINDKCQEWLINCMNVKRTSGNLPLNAYVIKSDWSLHAYKAMLVRYILPL